MRRSKKRGNEVLRAFISLFVKLAFSAAFLFLLFGFMFGLMIVDTNGMYPALHTGDIALYYRLDKSLNVDDVVVYEAGGERHIGRVLAVAGDAVNIDGSGGLYINGSIKRELIYYSTLPKENGAEFPLTVQEGEVFILGDLRTAANDSRDFGPVRVNQVKGRILTILRRRGL